MNLNLFNKEKAIEAREKGMDLAKQNRAQTLAVCRQIARNLARKYPTLSVSADDVYQQYHLSFGQLPELGNAAGSLFKKGDWECAGWVQSTRTTNHGRWIRAWRLK